MDFAESGIVYAFLIVPALFAFIVLIQGIDKILHDKNEGYVGVAFGIIFVIMIIAAYFLFIR